MISSGKQWGLNICDLRTIWWTKKSRYSYNWYFKNCTTFLNSNLLCVCASWVYQWPLESRTNNNNKWCMMWVDILAMRSENFYTTSVFALLCSWQTRPIIFPTIHFQLPAIYLYMIQLIMLSRFNFFSLNFQHHQRKHPY